MKNLILVLVFSLCSIMSIAQDHEHESESTPHKEHNFKKHRLALEFGYVHIPDAYEESIGIYTNIWFRICL